MNTLINSGPDDIVWVGMGDPGTRLLMSNTRAKVRWLQCVAVGGVVRKVRSTISFWISGP